MINTRTIVTAVLMWLALSPIAQAADRPGAAIGQPIPHDRALTDQTETPQIFKALKGDRGAILLFT